MQRDTKDQKNFTFHPTSIVTWIVVIWKLSSKFPYKRSSVRQQKNLEVPEAHNLLWLTNYIGEMNNDHFYGAYEFS